LCFDLVDVIVKAVKVVCRCCNTVGAKERTAVVLHKTDTRAQRNIMVVQLGVPVS
jgi:hypothetical protein